MSEAITLQLSSHGELTLPKSVCDRYDLNPGDLITLLDLNGVLMLSPRSSEVDLLADRMAQYLAEKGETLESMLRALRRLRIAVPSPIGTPGDFLERYRSSLSRRSSGRSVATD